MVYQGSKNKISVDLADIIEKHLQKLSKEHKDKKILYVEPFVGGANVIDKVAWPYSYGMDIMEPLITLHKQNQNAWLCNKELEPQDFSREAYNKMRDKWNNKEYDELIGHYGYLMSYNGRFFDGGYGVFDSNGKNLYLSRLKNLNKQAKLGFYATTKFIHSDYRNFNLSNDCGYVIYLDPPYKGTKQYSMKFNHDELWAKCKEWKEQNPNIIILLSELDAPDDLFDCIWAKDHQFTLRDRNNKNKKVVEKLFIYKG